MGRSYIHNPAGAQYYSLLTQVGYDLTPSPGYDCERMTLHCTMLYILWQFVKTNLWVMYLVTPILLHPLAWKNVKLSVLD